MKKNIVALIAVISCAYGFVNTVWLGMNGERCAGSAFHARHLMRAAEFYNGMREGLPLSDFLQMLHKDSRHPAPLYSLSVAAAMMALGKNIPLITGVFNFLFFILALLFLIKLAEELGYRKEVAVWAVIIFSLYPAVYGLSRLFGAFDFQVMAMMPLAMWCLLKTRRFKSRRYSVILGLVIAAGMLVKDTFGGYFGGPLFYAAFEALRRRPAKNVRINVLLAAGIAAILMAPYYTHPVIIQKEATELFRSHAEGLGFIIDKWDAYTVELSENLFSPPFFILFVWALYWANRRKPHDYRMTLLLLWVCVPWTIIFLMLHHKSPSYFVPIMPAAALLSASSLFALGKRARRAAMGGLLAAGLIQFAVFSFGIGRENFRSVKIDLRGDKDLLYFNLHPGIVFHQDFRFNFDVYLRAARLISGLDKIRPRKTRVMILPTPATREYITFYHLLDWLYQLDYSYTGGLGKMFNEEFFDKDVDSVLLPLRSGWKTADFVDFHYRKGIESGAFEEDDDGEKIAPNPERLMRRLEKYLAGFPVRESIGSDGENEFWLLSKKPQP